MSRVGKFFDVNVEDDSKTDCVYYDSDLMTNISHSRTQISALSRDPRRLLNPKVMKGVYEDTLGKMKTLHILTHSVPHNSQSCSKCGYPGVIKCVSATLCDTRNNWVNYVLDIFSVDKIRIKKQLVWETLFKKELFCERTVIENGINASSSKHIGLYDLSTTVNND
tara:strand:- start:302 stop:799 length:498 start_codon:yes stop_codon:yes gene_type:complete